MMRARGATVALLALLGIGAAPATGAAALPLLKPKPVPLIAPVAPIAAADPVGAARGTMIMVHAGGWAGHDAHAQGLLMKRPGELLRERGWRVVSIDYNEGTQGLQDVLNTAGDELARKTGDGPLCLYGESSGAHLALVAAARLRAIDCVIGLGTPTDLVLYQAEAAISPDARIRLIASQITRFFGTVLADIAPWNLISLAPTIPADVLLIHEADDSVITRVHDVRFQLARPTTQSVELEAGNPANPSAGFVHGTVSDAGRAMYGASIGAFADRAVAAQQAERSAAPMRCPSTRRSIAEVGLARMRSALRCLARADSASLRADSASQPAGTGAWRESSFRLRGEINAARIWSHLRETRSGKRALLAVSKRRADITVQASDRSRVTLRATR